MLAYEYVDVMMAIQAYDLLVLILITVVLREGEITII